MKSAAFTIKVFGVYAMVTGLNLMAAPNLLLGTLGFPATNDIWVRVLGALAVVLGYYYFACGFGNARTFFRASIHGRLFFCGACIALVMLAGAPPMLMLFGAVDALAAAWTYTALRAERSS